MQQATGISNSGIARYASGWNCLRPTVSSHRLIIFAFVSLSPCFALLTMSREYVYSEMRSFAYPVLLIQILIAVAALVHRRRDTRILEGAKSSTLVFALLFIGAMVVSLLGADFDRDKASMGYFATTVHLFYGGALWSLFKDFPDLRKKCLVAMACGLGLHVIIAYAFAVAMAGAPDFAWVRFGVGVTNIRHLGYIAVALTGLAGGLYLAAGNANESRIFLFLIFLGAFLVMWSGGRGAFGAFVIQLLALLALAPPAKRRNFAAMAVGVTMLATVAASVYVPDPQLGPGNIFSRINPVATGQEAFVSSRSTVWRQTIAMIPDRLWFGHGEGQFIGLVRVTEQKLNHPHNLILQLLFQWGIVGTLALAAYLAAIVLPKLKIIFARDPIAVATTSVGIGLGALSMVDGPFYYALPVAVFTLSVAALAAAPPSIIEPDTAEYN